MTKLHYSAVPDQIAVPLRDFPRLCIADLNADVRKSDDREESLGATTVIRPSPLFWAGKGSGAFVDLLRNLLPFRPRLSSLAVVPVGHNDSIVLRGPGDGVSCSEDRSVETAELVPFFFPFSPPSSVMPRMSLYQICVSRPFLTSSH